MALQPEQIERRIVTAGGDDVLLFHTGWSVFSNFYSSPFTIDGQRYANVEQYYQVQKAKRFADANSVIEILKVRSPRKCKEIGRNIANFNLNEWLQVADGVMLQGVKEKFLQNVSAREQLKATGTAILAEATRFDKYWAIGLDIGDFNTADIGNWPGSNKLGYILMNVRSMMP
jgi:ribA/ribD-fused uncharacterized protein